MAVKFLVSLVFFVPIPIAPFNQRTPEPAPAAAKGMPKPAEFATPEQAAQTTLPVKAPHQVPPSAKPFSLMHALAVVWLIGFLGVVGRDVNAWMRVRRMLKDSSFAPLSETLEVLGLGSQLVGLRLRTVPHLISPALVGSFRPTILVPQNYTDVSRDAITSAMAHELAHLKRKDLGWVAISEFAKAVFWFNPLIWIAYREELTESEIASDAMARRWTETSPKAYAEHLLEWIETPSIGPVQMKPLPGLLLSTHELKKRMKAMSLNRYTGRSTAVFGILIAVPLALGFMPIRFSNPNRGLAASPWPKEFADLRNTGRGQGSGAKGKLAWTFSTGDEVGASFALGADGTLYAPSNDDKLYALDSKTGKQLWSFLCDTDDEAVGEAKPPLTAAPAVSVDGMVIEGAQDGFIYGISTDSGLQMWSKPVNSFVYAGASIAPNGTVYFGGGDNTIYAADGQTGDSKWTCATTSMVTSGPAIGQDGTVYVGSHDNRLYALDGNTGAVKWFFTAKGAVAASPAVGDDGTVYFGSWDHYVYAVDGKTGAKKWSFKTGDQVGSTPAIGKDGTVYIGGEDRKLYALDGQTGAVKWSFLSNGKVECSVAIATDGTVYLGSLDRHLYALDGRTGAVRWSFLAGDAINSAPIIDRDGTIYFGCNDHKVYALR